MGDVRSRAVVAWVVAVAISAGVAATVMAGGGFGLLGGAGFDSMYLNGDASHVTTLVATADSQVENASEMRLVPPLRMVDGSAGGNFVAAVAQDGSLWGWGYAPNALGGYDGAPYQANPVRIGLASDWSTATAGASAAYALKSNGTLWAWGSNYNGQLGQADTVARVGLVQVAVGSTWRQVAAGDSHALAIRSDGTLWAWGGNSWGQLAQSSGSSNATPTQVLPGQFFKYVAAAGNASYAITTAGTLYAWGQNDQAQLGRGYSAGGTNYTPQALAGSGWAAVDASSIHASAVDTSGAVWVWGNNTAGQAGQGSTTPSLVLSPTKVPGLTGVESVACYGAGTLARIPSGTVYAWGGNLNGEIGTGDTSNRTSPVVVGAGRAFDHITGAQWTCLYRSGSSLVASGHNGAYVFGDPSLPSSSTLVTVGADWEPYAASRPVRFASWDGTQAVSIMYRSAVGSQTIISDAIIVDTAAPSGALAVNAGEARVRDAEAVLYNTVAGATRMRVNGGAWTPYSAETTYALGAGDGERSVVVDFSDDASNTLSIEDTITVDTVPPAGTISINAGAATTRNRRIRVSVSGGDAVAMRTPGMGTWQSLYLGGDTLMGIRSDGTLWGTGTNAAGSIGDGTTTWRRAFSQTLASGTATWTSIAVGNQHVLGVRSDGSLWAWGNNLSGQLGLGAVSSGASVPTRIGGANDWWKVAAGSSTSFAIKTNGALYAWGENANGQLGLGNTTSPVVTPAIVGAGTTYRHVAASGIHAVGIRLDGSLWGWGYNADGQVGDGSTTQRTAPVRIGTATDWNSVSVGSATSAATKTNGTLWMWGSGSYGVLGNGSTSRVTAPAQLGSATDWGAVSLSVYSVIARKTDGTLWTWGMNQNGQLGDRTKIDRMTPRRFGSRSDWTWAALNSSMGAARATDGSLWCWGSNSGRFGDGTTTDAFHPVSGDWLTVTSSYIETLTAGDGVKTLSLGLRDEAGNETTVTDTILLDSTIPTGVVSVNGGAPLATSSAITVTNTVTWATQMRQAPPITSVSAGDNYFVAIGADAVAYGAGAYMSGQLGPIPGTANIPTPAFGKRGWAAVSAGYTHSLMIGSDGSLWSVGTGSNGELGVGSALSTTTPQRIGTATNWVSVAAGQNHSAAVNSAGELYAWGFNGWGQIGDGTQTMRLSPVLIGTGYKQVAANYYYTLAVKTNGQMFAWGMNQYGVHGNGGTATSFSPTLVSGTGWASVSAGRSHAVGLKTDGTLWAWGLGTSGQLTGSTSAYWPFQIGSGFKAAAAGDAHSGGVKTDGTLWMCGAGTNGQLGDGGLANSTVLKRIGTDADWAGLSLGTMFSVGIKDDGTIRSWGYNQSYRLGDNTTTQRTTPVMTGLPGWVPYVSSYTTSAPLPSGQASIWNGFMDEAGNVVYLSDGIAFDQNAPVTTASGVSAGWTVANQTVSLTATDDAGVDTVQYALDGGDAVAYSGPVVISKEGTTTFAYRATDIAGRVETTKTVLVRIDRSNPLLSSNLVEGWIPTTTITASAVDSHSGVSGIGATVNGVPTPISGGRIVLPEGTHVVSLTASDVAGNTESRLATVGIDVGAPTTTIGGVPGGWVSSPATLSLSASDTRSGVGVVHYRIDAGATQVYAGPFAVGNGSHVVEYWAQDVAGNVEPVNSAVVRVDTAAPVTSSTANGTWRGSPEQVTLIPTDAETTVDATEYRVDGAASQPYLAPFTIATEGTHTLEFWSTDAMGNVETVRSTQVRLDYTPPHTTLAGVPSGIRNAAVELVPTATDSGSGVARIYYRVNGGQARPFSDDQTAIVVDADGVTTVEYWAVDGVGNIEASHSESVEIDYAVSGGGSTSNTVNAACIVCHGAAGAPPQMAVNFAVESVDRETACPRCHTYGLAGTHPNHYAGGNCGSVCHAGQMGASTLAATPTKITPYGSFASESSKDATSGDLHVIHAAVLWPGTVTKGTYKCGSCHAPAACEACHSGGVNAAHAQHSTYGNVRYAARTSASTRVCYGVIGEDQSLDSVTVVNQQCGIGECHDTGGLAGSSAMSREDYSHPASGATPENVVTRTGTWITQSSTRYSMQRRSASVTKNSTLGIAFTGTKVAISGGKGPNFGQLEVLIDGVSVAVVSGYSASVVDKAVLFTSTDLPRGPHTVTVRVNGVRPAGSSGIAVAIDEFLVWDRQPATVAPACTATCHPDREVAHGYDDVDHVADVGAAIEPASGARCDACHSMDLMAEHTRDGSSSKAARCATCHSNPRRTFVSWNQSCQQGGCHTPGTTEQRHAGMSTRHAAVNAGTCMRNCHESNLPAEHAKAAGLRTPVTCVQCHTSPQFTAGARAVSYTGGCSACHAAPHSPSQAGDQACFDCHGADGAAIDPLAGDGTWSATGGDHAAGYATSAHGGTVAPGEVAGIDSNVTCEACHNHNAIGAGAATEYRVDGNRLTGAALCYECHSASGEETATALPNTWNGRDIAVEFARHSAHPVVASDVTAGALETTVAAFAQTTPLELLANALFQASVSSTQGVQLLWEDYTIPGQPRSLLHFLPESHQANARSFSQYDPELGLWNQWGYDPANPSFGAAYYGSSGVAIDDTYVWSVGRGFSSRMRYSVASNTWTTISDLPFVADYNVFAALDESRGIVYYAGNNTGGVVYPWRASDDTWLTPFSVKSAGGTALDFTNADIAYSPETDRLYIARKDWNQKPRLYWTASPSTMTSPAVYSEQELPWAFSTWGSGALETALIRFTKGGHDYLVFDCPTNEAYGYSRAYLISGLATGTHAMTPLPEFPWWSGSDGVSLAWDGADGIYVADENSGPNPGRITIPADPTNDAWGSWSAIPGRPSVYGEEMGASMAFMDVTTAPQFITGYRPSGTISAEVLLPGIANRWGALSWDAYRPTGTSVSLKVEVKDGEDWVVVPGMGNLTVSPVDLSGIGAPERIRITATLSTVEWAKSAALRSWSVTAAGNSDIHGPVASLSCVSCHNAHKVGAGGETAWDPARVSDPENTLLAPGDVTTFCLSCHSTGAFERNRTATEFTPYDIGFTAFGAQSFFPGWEKDLGLASFTSAGHFTTTGTKALCETCHDPHGSDGERLTAWTRPASFGGGVPGSRDNTSGAAFEESLCYQCHGNGTTGRQAPGAQDVASAVAQTYRHDPSGSGAHHDTEDAADTGASRHAECVDCHDPHAARPGVQPLGGTPIASPALMGATGLKPTWDGTPWSTLSGYTATKLLGRPGDVEAYVCFKCHTSASGRPAVAASSNGTTYTATDLAQEFNPANASFHNVLGLPASMKSSFVVGGTTYSWSLPANDKFLKPGWTKDSAVACSDCHTSGSLSSAKGPHGSSVRYLLDPQFPADWRNASLDWREPDGVWPSGQLICTKCHVFSPTQNNAHGAYAVLQGSVGNRIHTREYMESMKCTSCHIGIPHGWKRPRLLVAATDPAPYRVVGPRGPLQGIKLKNYTPNGWSHSDCQGCGIFAHTNASPLWP